MDRLLRRVIFYTILISLTFSILISGVFPTHVQADDTQDRYRKGTLDKLKKERYLKNASCSQFASLILRRVGLPAVGETSPVIGTRGNADRRGDHMVPPTLDDGTVRTQNPYSEYRVEAGTEVSSKFYWDLTLTRIREEQPGTRITSSSTFHFQLGAEENRATCDLLWINFSSSAGDLDGRYDLSRCIDLFDPKNKKTSASISRISRDCSIGLHYFKETKN
jgi:hypothetical protein